MKCSLYILSHPTLLNYFIFQYSSSFMGCSFNISESYLFCLLMLFMLIASFSGAI